MTPKTCRKRHLAVLLLSACFSGGAIAQEAGDPTDPATWRTPEFNAQWGLGYIYADYAYAMGVDGSGVKVGVIDSGFAKNHPEFAGRFEEGITVNPDRPWDIDLDSHSHGSAVAAVIAANRDGKGMHGVAPGATIVSVNAQSTDEGYEDGYINFQSAIDGIYALVSRDVHIINNSYGSGVAVTYDPQIILAEYELEIAAYRHAVANDTLMIWAIGNQSREQPSIEPGMPYLVPELERGWLAVAGAGYIYGNHCGVAKNWCLAAPADWIETVSGNGGYQSLDGTSFAAPHVAGAAALVKQMFPYMTMDQVRQVLLGTSIDIGDPGIDEVYGYGSLDAGAAVLGPGKFDWGNFNVSFDSGQSDWFNDITGAGGLVKSGDGVLAMYGDSTYSGQTHIDGGILALRGSITSDTFVSADGTLSGDGTIYGNVDNQGTVFGGWGGAGGTLTIDGNYHQSADASIRVKIGAKEGTSRIDVSGTAVLDGGTVDAYFDPVIYRGNATYTILSSAGLSGAFAPDVLEDYAFLDLSLGYDATNAYLNVMRNGTAFSDVGKTGNQKAVGDGIESLGGLALSGPVGSTDPSVLIYDLIISLNEEAARSAFDSLSGEIHSSVKSALIDESRFTRDVISARLRSAAGSVTPTMPVLAYGPDGTVPAEADASSSVWGQAYGSWGHMEGSGTARTSRSSGGLFIGADGDVGANWRAGFAAGYGSSSIDVDGRASSADVDSYTVAAYAGTRSGALAFRFGAAHTWHEVETDRLTAFGASAADYSARTAQAFGEVGYQIELDRVAFEPFANLAYVHLHTDGIGEDGSARLKSQSGNDDNLFTTLGLRVQGDIPAGDKSRLTAHGMLGWQHAFGDVSPETELAFTGGTPFSIEGVPMARDAVVAEAGLDFSLAKAITLGVSYTGQMSSSVQAHGLRGDFIWAF